MSAQLSLIIDASQIYGSDLASDIEAVVSCIPRYGGAKRTAREGLLRPIAYLYARMDLLDDSDARIVHRISRACTGIALDGPPPIRQFARLSGERWDGRGYGDSRAATVDIAPRHGDARWILDFRRNSGNASAVHHIHDMLGAMRPGLRALGCAASSTCILLPCLAPLVLALRWSAHVEAAAFLAGSGVAPKSGEWDQLVDQALARGLPWAVRLAELSARHPRDVLSRSLVWVHSRAVAR